MDRDDDLEVRGWMERWPDDSRSSQVHAEQVRDRQRVQQDIQEAWDRLMKGVFVPPEDGPYVCRGDVSESDIKLLKWALGL